LDLIFVLKPGVTTNHYFLAICSQHQINAAQLKIPEVFLIERQEIELLTAVLTLHQIKHGIFLMLFSRNGC